jgi:hypothetical protein
MRCNIVKSQKIEHGQKNFTWATGHNAILIHTINQNIMITKEEFAVDCNWNNTEDRFFDFTENDRNQLFKGLKQYLEDENDGEITNLKKGIKIPILAWSF